MDKGPVLMVGGTGAHGRKVVSLLSTFAILSLSQPRSFPDGGDHVKRSL
jgi:hypothetical protein